MASKQPAASPPPVAHQGLRTLLAAVLLVVATVVAYGPALGAGFIWDDDDYVTENPLLTEPGGLARIWLDPTATPQYYPLVHTSFWIEHQLWGLAPRGYHTVNVLLHALVALLLWRLLRRLEVPGAWVAAALFALHPVSVESVAWITERKNVLSAVFFLLALSAFVRYRPLGREAERGSWRWYGAALAAFTAALLSKTVTATLPAVILVLAWWKRGRLERRVVLPTLPMVALGAALGAVTVALEKSKVGASGEPWDFSWVDRVLIAGRAVWFYAGKLVWPHELAFIYPRWEIDPGALWQLAFPGAALAVLALLWWGRDRWGRGPLAAVLLFGGTLFPALGFFDVYPMLFSFVADHFQYLSSIALLTLAAAAGARWAGRLPGGRRAGAVAAAGVLLVLGVLTWRQARAYESAESLWRDTLAKNPDAWLAHGNLGALLLARGDDEEAAHHLEEALRLNARYPQGHHNLGLLRERQGRMADALAHQRALLEVNPGNAVALTGAGRLLLREGHAEEALPYLERAVALDPEAVEARLYLGEIARQAGRPEAALGHYQQVLARQPDHPRLLVTTAGLLLSLGRDADAAAMLDRLLATDPGHAAASGQLAHLLATSSDPAVRDGARAVELAERACRPADCANPALLDALAAAYAEVGRWEEAATAAARAVEGARAAGRPRMAQAYAVSLRLIEARRPLRRPPAG